MCLHAYTYMPIYTCSLIYILFGKHIHHTYSFSCMPAYKHIHTCAYALVNTCTHTHTPMRIHNHACKETKAQTRPHTGTDTFMHIQVYTLTQVCMCAGTYLYMSCTHVRVFACCTALPRPILPCHRVRYHTMLAPAALPCPAMPQHTTPYHTINSTIPCRAAQCSKTHSRGRYVSTYICKQMCTYIRMHNLCMHMCLHTYRPIYTTLTNVVVALPLLCIFPSRSHGPPVVDLKIKLHLGRQFDAISLQTTRARLLGYSIGHLHFVLHVQTPPGTDPSQCRKKPKPKP